ncbi:fibrinogen C domain-containing protein 1 [Condylostylus longicornis]|uniref:fibrinogen C domain-containing protein 1 n=1 Tax=Condylostylus longicornis TaxID=2530218 RepID=UPI00244DE450|nr:fibrinogen C domain-containing protein 1 [Condylostylus longicornis]
MKMKLLCHTFVIFNFIQIIFAVDYGPNTTTRHHKPNINRSISGNDGYCQRLYDRIVTLTSLDEQQIRQLETVDSKLVRMESNTQERLDAMRDELKEINKRTENLDWIDSKSKALLENLKVEVESMRQNLNDGHLRIRQTRSDTTDEQTFYETDQKLTNLTQMLSSLAAFLSSVRQGVFNVEEDFRALKTNISTLLQFSREIQKRQHSQPSKQFLNHAINNVRSSLCNENRGITNKLPSSCIDDNIKENQINKIEINQTPIGSFYVRCFTSDEYGRGWTVILNRFDGDINFYRNWLEYKNGFGNIAGEFFIGLDKLYAITSNRLHELLILLQDFEGNARYVRYSSFAIGSEKDMYALNILGDYDGNGGNSLQYSASYKFSTFDNDNDGWVEGNCAQSHTGAWWYNACEKSNLMGQYLGTKVEPHNNYRGMYWEGFNGSNYSLYAARMMIRPVEYSNDDY